MNFYVSVKLFRIDCRTGFQPVNILQDRLETCPTIFTFSTNRQSHKGLAVVQTRVRA
jgi:hypothetical protein